MERGRRLPMSCGTRQLGLTNLRTFGLRVYTLRAPPISAHDPPRCVSENTSSSVMNHELII